MRRLFGQLKAANCLNILFRAAIILLSLVARAEILPIKTYFSTDGLVYDKIYGAYQDSRDFVWFMPANGVSRFDGYKFVSYTMLEDGLKSSFVIDMVEDANGVYWFGTNVNKVYRFDARAKAEDKSQLMRENFQPVQFAGAASHARCRSLGHRLAGNGRHRRRENLEGNVSAARDFNAVGL